MTKRLPVTVLVILIAALAVAGCTSPSVNKGYVWLVDYQLDYLTLNESASSAATVSFVASTNSDVYHYPWCSHVSRIKAENRVSFPTAASAEAQGYHPCAVCHPPQ